ncbi:MAG TPA: UDP-N-acetylglucosamine 1-carboxyvinyltransferase, partial [Candidatus Paceibacterota bacterium]
MGEALLNFKIDGGKKLRGHITVNTSKNGAVAILCAALLNKGTTTVKDVPKIEEVERLVEVLESIGVAVTRSGRNMTISPPKKMALQSLDHSAAIRTRSIILFIAPLLHHLRKFRLPQAGGCKLGSRTVRPHFFALETLGVTFQSKGGNLEISHQGLLGNKTIILYEASDTATENALLAAAGIPGVTTIKYASANYQVQELCFFLEKLGIRISGIGTTTLVVHGKKSINKNVSYALSEDPIEAMFFLTAAIVTHSSIVIKRCPIEFLELELLTLEHMGFRYRIQRRYKARNGKTNLVDIQTHTSKLHAPPEKIHARPYPGLNMDNLPFFALIATQAKGQTLIHDWTYEKRALYYTELDKLGADTILADPHRLYVTGPTTLKAAELVCPPALRPAALLLLGMLGARGISLLRNVYSINRGYEDL